jgi:Family of unknown function (DUF6174)
VNHTDQARTISHHHSALTSLIRFLVILSACQPTTPSVPASTATPFSLAERALDRNQQKWQQAGISHYRFRLTIRCFCPDIQGPLLVEVENDQVVSMEYQSGSTLDTASREAFEPYGTINRIFALVTSDLHGERKEVTVTYDPTYGFPTEFFTDFHEGADDELTLMIEAFEVLS